MLLGDGLQQALVPDAGGAGARPGLDGALGDGQALVGDHEVRVELHPHAQAGAIGAGAVRAVEAEVARRDLAQADAAVDTGEVL